ncbi:hypothetical protein [Clostridium baratii]|uniref:Uncharacterized protein n=1 Tax=Clostridium baratii TaxID=1561 RepID=A0A174VDR0_9CLOT|nr:hypothetical protein [Clostridium baratii]CUQ30140.1 Uncharacterised protein [Clostridium baratii]
MNQYINKKNKLIDFNEYNSILNYENICDIDEKDKKYKVISGSIIPQLGHNKFEIIDFIKSNINNKLGYLIEDKCVLSELIDIQFVDDEYNYKIPFSALVKTNIKVSSKDQYCKTLFFRQNNNIKENLKSRKFLMAVKKETAISNIITITDWKRFIPSDLIYLSRKTW